MNNMIADPSIIQGIFFIDEKNKTSQLIGPELLKLQDTGLNNIQTTVEAMDVQQPKTKAYTRTNDTLTALENQFNKTLVKYNLTYKLFNEAVINQNKINKDVTKYFDKVVTTEDGNYSYINNYGYTHKFSTDAWSNKVLSCKSNPITISDVDYNKFKSGPNMGVHQPCGIAGMNIENRKTKERAWVDIKGYKHIYSTDLWENKMEMCNVPVKKLTNSEYNSIPQGGNMETTSNCLQLDIDPSLWTELNTLNDKLIHISKKISKEITRLKKSDVKLNSALAESQQKFSKSTNTLQYQKNQLNGHGQSLATINGEQESSEMTKDMNKIHSFVWKHVSIIVLVLTVRAYMSPASKTGDIIGLIFAIILLFVICRWIWNKLKK